MPKPRKAPVKTTIADILAGDSLNAVLAAITEDKGQIRAFMSIYLAEDGTLHIRHNGQLIGSMLVLMEQAKRILLEAEI